METKLQNVFKCDFCGRKMLSKGAMTRHERFCKDNPNNWHQCFKRCDFLKKETETVYSGSYYEPEADHWVTHFTCEKTGKRMYSYKFEKSKGFKPVYINGLERMPLHCPLYESDTWVESTTDLTIPVSEKPLSEGA